MLPWFERPYIFDVRARPNTISSTSGSRDLQMVNISLRVLTRPDSGRLQEIYRTLGMDYDQRVLPSIIQETLKGVIAQYNAAQLLTQRELVSKDIRRVLMERASRFNIVLEDVSITNLTFSREYTAAVEAKQARRRPPRACSTRRSAIIPAKPPVAGCLTKPGIQRLLRVRAGGAAGCGARALHRDAGRAGEEVHHCACQG